MKVKGRPSNSGTMISSLPFDIAIKIALSLEVLDVCALGSCSRLWREICCSDFLWESLAKERWPSLPFLCSSSYTSDPLVKRWREIYVRLHREMAGKANGVIESVEHSSPHDSLRVGDCYKAIEDLHSVQLSFKDVQIFFFKPKFNALLNMVGLLYCIFGLKVPAECVRSSLLSCGISEQQVRIRWWRISRLFFGIGFRMNEEPNSCVISLADLTTSKGDLILQVLRRGATRESLRVGISIPNTTTQSSQR